MTKKELPYKIWTQVHKMDKNSLDEIERKNLILRRINFHVKSGVYGLVNDYHSFQFGITKSMEDIQSHNAIYLLKIMRNERFVENL